MYSVILTIFEFSNTYAVKCDVPLKGKKTVTGNSVKDGLFSFELYDANGKLLETVSNDEKGEFAFSDLHYTQADVNEKTHTATYTYTVKEVQGSEAGAEKPHAPHRL